MKRLLLLVFFLSVVTGAFCQTGYTCATARVISSLPYQDDYTTCGSGNDISTGTCNNTYSSGEDVIYTLTISNAPITVSFTLSNVPGTSYPSIMVSANCTFGTCLGYFSGPSAAAGTVNFTANGTYFIKIDNWSPPNCYGYRLNINPPPQNDLICNAIPLSVNGACVNTNNTLATNTAASDVSACINESHTLWYYFDATDDSITVTSSNSHVYGEMAVFSSSNDLCTGTLTQINCQTNTTLTKLVFKLTGLTVGKRYFVMVDGWATNTGNFCVSVIKTPPPPPVFGSSCVNARVLFPRTTCAVDPTTQTQPNDNIGNVLNSSYLNGGIPPATCDFTETFLNVSSANFSNENNCAGTSKKASWVEFKATAGTTTLRNNATSGGNADLNYEVYSGACPSLSLIGCYSVVKGGSVNVTTTAGTTYFIKITAGNSNANTNQHWLCLTSGVNTAANPIDNCANAYAVTDGVPVSGNTAMATQDGNANLCAGTGSVPNNNVWFKWTVPATWAPGAAAFVHVYEQDCNSVGGVQIDVYDKTVNCGNVSTGTPACVAYTAPDNTESFYASWVPSIGSTYYITIDGSCGTVCSFMLQINNTASVTVPVKLLNFTGKQSDIGVQLTWTTASEQENDKFLIERSLNGRDFELIGTVPGAGNSSFPINYQFTDPHPGRSINYYRLKQADRNGIFSYSKIIVVYTKEPGIAITGIAPNPAGKLISYSFYSPEEMGTEVMAEIFDLSGRVISREALRAGTGDNIFSFDVSGLHEGLYFLKISSSKGLSDHMKFMKQQE